MAIGVLLLLFVSTAAAQVPTAVRSPVAKEDGRFGNSIAGIEDVDGDGHGDFLVGARYHDGGAVSSGQAYLFSGATQGLIATLGSINPTGGGNFGNSVAGVPDTDGDGVPDLLVGAELENGGANDAGRAYLFSGATRSLLRVFASPNPEANGRFGASVAGVPDVNGDGRGDILIGAPLEDAPASSAGRAYLYSGATGARLATIESPSADFEGTFGRPVAGVPDLNGDGLGDLLIGAPREDGGGFSETGRVWVLSGATQEVIAGLISPNAEEDGDFGRSVAGVGDTNGDGVPDFIVGAPREGKNGARDVGRAYLYSGATRDLLATLTSPDSPGDAWFGHASAGVQDVDGDGANDLLVGAYREDAQIEHVGRAYLFSGATQMLLATLESPTPRQSAFYGISVASIPDANGDARGDLLVSNAYEDLILRDGAVEDVGRVYLYTTAQVSTSLDGPEGWRLLAAPAVTSVSDLLSGLYTQGSGGATTSDGSPSIYRYDESVWGPRNLGFKGVPTLHEPATPGRGYAVYVYEDDDPIAGGVQGGFPKTLNLAGLSLTGADVTFPVSFTATAAVQEDGWNLVGNPYDASLNWDASGWIKARVDNAIYVWDPTAGVYKSWNGTAGSLGDGRVDAFQGFWVKAFAPDPQLVAPASVRAVPPGAASTSLGLAVEGTVAGQRVRDELFVTFHDDALVGLDARDAYELVPFRDPYAALYALTDGVALDISALPPGEDVVEVPLDVAAVAGGAFTGGAMTLSWPDLSALPSSWRLTLTDTRENTSVDLRAETSYAFSIASSSRRARDVAKGKAPHETPPVPTPLFDAEETEHRRSAGARFVLRIDASSSVASEDEADTDFGLASVRPNPLGGRGVVVARLSEAGPARLAVYDALGREAAVLVDDVLPAGRHEVALDPAALGLAAGAYVVRWQSAERTDAQTITILR